MTKNIGTAVAGNKVIRLRFPPGFYPRIARVLEKGQYSTQNELVKDALRKLLDELERKDNCQR